MLANGNTFNFDNYIFEHEHGFNYCKNVTDIEFILNKGEKKIIKNP